MSIVINCMENDFIFIHIPRTAGRSIHSHLGIFFDGNHRTIKDYIEELTEPVVRERYKFTFIRNPWERTVAMWHMYLYKLYQPDDFFVLSFEEWLLKKLNGWTQGNLLIDELIYCRDKNDNILIDEFLRFENLYSEVEHLSKKLNLPYTKLPNVGTDEKPKNDKEAGEKLTDSIQSYSDSGIITLDEKKRLLSNLPFVSINYKNMYNQHLIDLVEKENVELIRKFGYTF